MRFRSWALIVSILLLVAAPVHAQNQSSAPVMGPDTFSGTATATALELTLADNGLVVGFSEAAVQSGPTEDGCEGEARACARAAGELLQGPTATASAPGDEGPNEATAIPIPEQFSPLLTGAIGRATAEATANGDLRGRGDGGVASINFTATQSLAENIPIQDALEQISENLLGPIAEGDPTGQLGPRLKASVDQLNENLSAAPLLQLDVGPSWSEVTNVDEVTTATASAQGATIVLSPTPASLPGAPEGLVIIEVGAARVNVSSDTQAATADFDPALVRVRIFDPTTGEYDVLAVAPGESACIPGIEGTPLQICIGAGFGDTTVEGAAAAATAAGVSITAFQDPLPTLRLRLAAAEAGVNAEAGVCVENCDPRPPCPDPNNPECDPECPDPDNPACDPEPKCPDPSLVWPNCLPETGTTAALPAIGMLGIGSLALFGIRRRRAL